MEHADHADRVLTSVCCVCKECVSSAWGKCDIINVTHYQRFCRICHKPQDGNTVSCY